MKKWPGAKWWKFDFHTHTPASKDFKENGVTPKDWLKRFMQAKIDCIAITDHNSGEWIDKLQRALQELNNQSDFYHPLHLFPGVEISASGGVHILAIFDLTKTTSDIDSLLGAVGYKGTKGDSGAVTKKSLNEVIDLIKEHNAIPIPAHIDKNKGLFKEFKGTTLQQVLTNNNVYAMELCDTNYPKPQIYNDKKIEWTEVCGSDTHFRENDRFGHFTWVKMDKPSIEGLKLALMDGKISVNRCMEDQPNQRSSFIIEEVTIENAKYIGRPELKIQFSPLLNTIIGGRGSGKTTLLEFIRLLLRRDKDLPELLIKENQKYFNIGDNGLLLDNSKLSLIYYKDNHRYRLNWSFKSDSLSLEVDAKDDKWNPEEGEIKTLFPVHIYSQKQIFALAQAPDALLGIIDKDPNVKCEELKKKRNDFINSYKILQQRRKELSEKVAEENKLKGQLNDVTRQIEQIEKSGHKKILQNYRLRQKQLSTIEGLEKSWNSKILELQDLDKSTYSPHNKDIFDRHTDILKAISDTNKKWENLNKELTGLTQKAKDILNTWEQEKKRSLWMTSIKHDVEQYTTIQVQLKQQNIDPEKYPQLLISQSHYQKELDKIKEYTKSVEKYHQESQDVLKELQQNREQLTKNRIFFLRSILEGNSFVHIKVKPFGQKWEGIEKDLRQLLRCEDSRFIGDFEILKEEYGNKTNKQMAIENLKNRLKDIYQKTEINVQDKRFAQYIQGLPQETIGNLMCWFPEDGLDITFGRDQRNIRQGSPCQKNAALLAFILSYGDEPLLLDQPEDDLDNELIYDLIVKQLRQIKSQRQVIVVTHNANIVVNGDAEIVFPLTVKNGQSIIDHSSSIQDSQIREKICNVLEGGQEAFRQRYKRIHLEQNNV